MWPNNRFISGSGGQFDLEAMIKEIAGFFTEKESGDLCFGKSFSDYKMIIGTDSEEGGDETDFVIVVALWRKGRGGRYFYQHSKKPRYFSFTPRIFQEAIFSIELAQTLLQSLHSRLFFFKNDGQEKEFIEHNLEIHLDIGSVQGKNGTASLVKGIVGMVRGYGFNNIKIKPEAYGATTIADRHC